MTRTLKTQTLPLTARKKRTIDPARVVMEKPGLGKNKNKAEISQEETEKARKNLFGLQKRSHKKSTGHSRYKGKRGGEKRGGGGAGTWGMWSLYQGGQGWGKRQVQGGKLAKKTR